MEEYDRLGRLYFPQSKDGRIRLKLYLDETAGQPMQNLWDDISPLNSQSQERLGYPTQKPLALLGPVRA
jgi:site-specific DNA-methyltransferase (adenine-specific)